MSFFGKLKQMAGIGTLDVRAEVPPQFRAADGVLAGTLHLTAKSDQTVLAIVLKLEETFTAGRGDDERSRHFTLGEVRLGEPFTMTAGETKAVPVSLPFQLLKSQNEQLQERGGMLGGLGKVAAFAAGERSEYTFRAVVDLKDVALDPTAEVPMKLVP